MSCIKDISAKNNNSKISITGAGVFHVINRLNSQFLLYMAISSCIA